ncbi:phosphodiester glycosidase family protein [Georgenia sp. MJ170]|uniref:phosphodiester glycosidase family protein n=1 Tax=Georgenia sunbinii TaxID=3117728 RepID=UPI002F26D4C3
MSVEPVHTERRPRDVVISILAVLGVAAIPAAGATAAPATESLDLTNSGTAVVHRQDETTVSPGVRLTEFTRYEPAGWLRGAVLEVDLENPAISIDYLHPGAVAENKTVLDMVEETGAFAGVNGDFFDINNSGAANGIGVDEDGGILTSPVPGHNNALVIDSRGLGHITEVALEGRVVINDGATELPVVGVNSTNFTADGVGVFTADWGTYQRANHLTDLADAVEVWIDESSQVVTTAQPVGDGEIPAGVRVLVVPAGPAAEQFRALELGDAVQVSYSIRSDADEAVVAIGGQAGQHLVTDGVPATFSDATVHPRTAVGLDDDGTRLILAAVDGRSDASRGLSLSELAVFMNDLGATNALNLDGGGSTTLVSQRPGEEGAEVINEPSDGYEREDANGIGVVVEEGSGVVQSYTVRPQLRADDADRVFPGLHRPLEALGYDENHHAVETPAETWTSSDPDVLEVGPDGLATAGESGTATVTAATGEAAGEAEVAVLGELVRIEAVPNVLAMPSPDDVAQLAIVGYDARGYSAPIDFADITVDGHEGTLEVTRGMRASVDVNAVIENGAADLTVSVGEHEAGVAVLVGTEDVLATSFENFDDWYTTGARSENEIAPSEGREDDSGVALTVNFDAATGTRNANILPEEPFEPFDGQLQEIGAWFKGDGRGSPETYFWVRDAEGVRTPIYGPSVEGTEWQWISVPVSQNLSFPLAFDGLAVFETGAANQYQSTILVDDVEAVVAPLADAPQAGRYRDAAVAPAGATDDAALRVAVMSDAQFVARNPESEIVAAARQTLQEIVAEDPDVLVINGDLVDEAAPEDFDLAREILDSELAGADFPWYYVPGNHEIMGGEIDNFIAEFGPTHQHFDVAGTRFITLNSATGRLGSEFGQVAMLREQLDLAAEDPEISGVLVFAHHPTRDFLPTAASQMSDRHEAAMLEDWLSDFRNGSGKSAAMIASHVGAFDVRSQDGVVHAINGNSGKGPSSTPDNGGFTGWTMLGIDPEHGEWRAAEAEWLDVEINPRTESIAITAPDQLAGDDFAQVSAVLTQDETRDVPVQWPVSSRWSGGNGVHVGDLATAAAGALVALDPATGLLSALDRRWDGDAFVPAGSAQEPTGEERTESVEISVTVNGVTAAHPIDVTVPVVAEVAPEPEPTDGATEEPTDGATEEPTDGATEEPTDSGIRVSLGSDAVVRGEDVSLTAQGFLPNERVEIELRPGGGLLATTQADASGIVSATVTVPADTEPGDYRLAVVGLDSGDVGEAEVTVTVANAGGDGPGGSGDDLATTGVSAGLLGGVSALLLMTGVAIATTRRRRQQLIS